MGQRRGGGWAVKNLAPGLCLPLCDLESITFPLWARVASSVNGGWKAGLHFSSHNLGDLGDQLGIRHPGR